MTRQTAEKYTQFLYELIDQKQFGGASNIGNYISKYGISAEFFTFLVKREYFKRVEGTKLYIPYGIENVSPLNEENVQILINEFNRWRQIKKNAGIEESNPPIRYSSEEAGLANYTTKALLDELKRRGYTGVLTIKKELRF